MTNLSSIPDPTAEQLLQEYRFHCDHPLPLYNPLLDGDRDDDSADLGPRNYSRFVEGDLIPVTDHASQLFAKRCADLHDQILASATDDSGDETGENNEENNTAAKNADGAEDNDNNNKEGDNKNNTDNPKSKGDKKQNNNPKNNNTTTPTATKMLHIPYPLFIEFATLFNQLSQPSSSLPSPDSISSPAENTSNDDPTDPKMLHIPADKLMALVSSQTWREMGHADDLAGAEK